jgi:hypothetical protein
VNGIFHALDEPVAMLEEQLDRRPPPVRVIYDKSTIDGVFGKVGR